MAPRWLCVVVLLHAVALAKVMVGSNRSITVASIRFSFLSPSVLRIETAGTKEDRPSITFTSREALPVPVYKVLHQTPVALAVQTASYTLQFFAPGGGSNAPDCGHLNLTLASGAVVCPFNTSAPVPMDPLFAGIISDEWTDLIQQGPEGGNLGGSLDSLDCYLGAIICYTALQSRMQLGLVSRAGYVVVNDSATALWDDDKVFPWRIPRQPGSGLDYYVFAHGLQFKQALADFVGLAGPVPLKPWRAHGVWQSRETPMTDVLAREVVGLYDANELPLNMFVLDYGWHVGPYDPSDVNETCNAPNHGAGMCRQGFGGYVWDRTFFPDPVGFQAWAHETADLELCLNIHDQCGIDSCQMNYEAAALAVGIDPATRTPVECAFTNKAYALAESELVLETGDNAAIDYWWNDYGLGGGFILGGFQLMCDINDNSTVPPFNYGHCMHCYDESITQKPVLWNAYVRVIRRQQRDLRGMVLSIYGGLGHHRYPAVGSGDTFEDWITLSFEVWLTLTAANVATEWSHDLGGFMLGTMSVIHPDGTWTHDPELYLRWLQAGVFQPIFRTHASEGGNNWPWVYPNFELMQAAFQLRNAFVPYIYTASRQAYDTGILMAHPMYYEWPLEPEAYTVSTLTNASTPLQHMFGGAFTVAPITSAVDAVTGTIVWPLWVPPGLWVDWWNGVTIMGPRQYIRQYGTEQIPLLVRGGAVVPMKTVADAKSLAPAQLVLAVAVPQGTAVPPATPYELYEDDGASLAYQRGQYLVLQAAFSSGNSSAELVVVPSARGNGYSGAPTMRSYLVEFRNAPATASNVVCTACGAAFNWYWQDDAGLPLLIAATGLLNSTIPFTVSYTTSS